MYLGGLLWVMRIKKRKPHSIANWSSQDKPREKLLAKGKAALSDAELLAILLCVGTPTLNVLEVAQGVLKVSNNSLYDLSRLNINDLIKVKGIGQAKAITIMAALELGNRRKERGFSSKPKIVGSRDAYEFLRSDLSFLPHEEFWVLLLDRSNRLIRKVQVSCGGVAGTVADPKIIFKMAVIELASGIIVAHNHPSGNANASEADIKLTNKLKEAAKLFDIQLLDHIIVAGQNYFSFADASML